MSNNGKEVLSLITDLVLCAIGIIIHHAVKHYRHSDAIFIIAHVIVMVGVACLVMHNYMSGLEIIAIGVRTQWNALVYFRMPSRPHTQPYKTETVL